MSFCAMSSPAKNPMNPSPESRPAEVLVRLKLSRNCGRNSPKPMRAGPKVMAVAANPASESFQNGAIPRLLGPLAVKGKYLNRCEKGVVFWWAACRGRAAYALVKVS